MKVLVIGSGGREHAVAEAFARSDAVSKVKVAPGNAGIARSFETLPLNNMEQQLQWCESNRPDLVFIGPEQPLEQGMADRLNQMGIPCVGPSRAAARIESSKIFAKRLMQKYNVPTAAFFHSYSLDEAMDYVADSCPYPAVIKADYLAAGKGVIIVQNQAEAEDALLQLLANSSESSPKGVVIEEFLQGWEVSLFAVTDAVDYVTTLFSQDHKQLLDGDRGPNTGGMGAFAPVWEAEPWRSQIHQEIVEPILKAMREEGCPFAGFLYCGLMITSAGAKVVEFNCRLGDPEAQALLPLLDTDFYELCIAITQDRVCSLNLQWKDETCVAVILASDGYPGSYEKGMPITISSPHYNRVYYAGVAQEDGTLITNGGRVLCVSALGKDREAARHAAYNDINKINFANKRFRRDIAQRNNKL